MITIPLSWKRWRTSSFCFNNFDTNGKMGKWRGNEYSIVFIDAQNFHRTISFINKMFTDFYHGKYIKSSWLSEDDVQIVVAEMQYIFIYFNIIKQKRMFIVFCSLVSFKTYFQKYFILEIFPQKWFKTKGWNMCINNW